MSIANFALKWLPTKIVAALLFLSGLAIPDITTELWGKWSFENDALDGSGNGNHGTPVGSPTYAFGTNSTLGATTSYALTTGTGKYIDVGAGPSLSNQVTMAAWVYFTGAHGSGTQYAIMSRFNGSGFFMSLYDTGGNLRFYVNGTTLLSAAMIPANTWVHVACVYNGANLMVYTNGLPANSSSPLTGNILVSGNLLIGARGDSTTINFVGRIDEAYLFRRALSASDISDLVAASLSKAYPINIFLSGRVSSLRGSPLPGVLIWQSNAYSAGGVYSSGDGSFTLPMPQFTNVTIRLTAPKGTQVPTTLTNIVTPTTNFVMNFTAAASGDTTTFRAPSLYSPSLGDLQVEVQRNTDAGERVVLNLVSATGNTKWRLSDSTLTGKANFLTVPGNSLMRLLTTGTYILEMKIMPTTGFEDDPRNQVVRKILIVGR